MTTGVLFVGWKRPVPGREQQAMGLLQKGMEFYAKSQSDGKIESFEPVILAQHGVDLNGFILVKGDPVKLSELRREDDFVENVTEAGYCLEGFGVVEGLCGEGIANVLSRLSKLSGK